MVNIGWVIWPQNGTRTHAQRTRGTVAPDHHACGGGVGQLTSPQGLVLYRDVLYVSDSLNHRVAMFHPLLLDPLGEPFGHEGAGAGELCYPHGLAVRATPHDAMQGVPL